MATLALFSTDIKDLAKIAIDKAKKARQEELAFRYRRVHSERMLAFIDSLTNKPRLTDAELIAMYDNDGSLEASAARYHSDRPLEQVVEKANALMIMATIGHERALGVEKFVKDHPNVINPIVPCTGTITISDEDIVALRLSPDDIVLVNSELLK
jgi:hypothetical protein